MTSIRSKILAGCLALTALTAMLGIYAHRAERELGGLALNIYDEAFMGVSYLRSAQVGFAFLAASARHGAVDPNAAAAVIDDLRVARDRAMSPQGRAMVERLSDAIASVAARGGDDGAEPSLASVQSQFENAVETFAGDGFRYRRGVGTLVADEVRQSSIVVGATVVGALAITLLLTNLIAPPVRRAVRIAQAIAAGRLDNVISVTGRGETADLLCALSVMQSSIAEALARIHTLMQEQATNHAGELAAQHARLEAALNNMDQGLCLFGADGCLAVTNRRFV